MSAPAKAVSDVTIYIEEYADFIATLHPTPAESGRWGRLWGQLSLSQRQKLVQRARAFNAEAAR